MANRDADSETAGVFDRVRGLLDRWLGQLPGASLVARAYTTVEREVLRDLKVRLERLEGRPPASIEERSRHEPANGAAPPPPTPRSLLAELLDRSIDQDEAEAESDAFVAILRQLVPDEARILGALSDGGVFPLLHVMAGSWMVGTPSTRVLGNVTSVGQAAGVQCRGMTPQYVAHLRELGLVELGPEDPTITVKYEILETDGQVRETIRRIEHGEKRAKPRIVRRSLRMTAFGRRLWDACQRSEEAP
jgi:hypothetical protein